MNQQGPSDDQVRNTYKNSVWSKGVLGVSLRKGSKKGSSCKRDEALFIVGWATACRRSHMMRRPQRDRLLGDDG